MTEIREHARMVYSCYRCCRAFHTRVNFQSGISWLSHTSPTCSLLRCSPITLFFSWIYFLWQLPTSGRSFSPLSPGEACTAPCLASTMQLSHPHCLFHSTQSAAVPCPTPAEFPSRGSYFLRDMKVNPFLVTVYVSACAGWDPLGLKLFL